MMNKLYIGSDLRMYDISEYNKVRKLIKDDRYPRGFGPNKQRGWWRYFDFDGSEHIEIKYRIEVNDPPWYMPLTDEEVQLGLILGIIERCGIKHWYWYEYRDDFYYFSEDFGSITYDINKIKVVVSK